MHLKRHDLPRTGVVHGFSGSLQQAERFVQLGYKIGVGGTITYPRASKTRDVIAKLPLASLLLETDAPDMPLNGFQGSLIARNRPRGCLPCFASYARNPRMKLPKCCLITRIRCLTCRRPDKAFTPHPACHKYSAGNINRLTPRTFNASANCSTSSGVALGQLCASPYTPWA